jgi:asparagine synthase (glutamine-hydrolysing)
MASAVEMRVPYLDDRVQSAVRSLAPAELVDTDLGITKRVLRRSAVRRYGAPMLDIALRRKVMMPDAADRHAMRLDELCERSISDEVVRRSDFGPCFATKRDFVLFEIFRRMCLAGSPDRAECPPIGELVADLGGARVTGVA